MADTATHGDFADILAVAKPELRPLCAALRSSVFSQHPGVTEIVWPKQKIASFGFGPKKMTEHYAYIAVQGGHINLGFYYGASLPDPHKLLEGTGKKLRHIELHKTTDAQSSAVITLLNHAFTERKQRAE